MEKLSRSENINGFASTVFSAEAEDVTLKIWLSDILFKVNMVEGSMRSNYFNDRRLMLKVGSKSTIEIPFKSEVIHELTDATFK